MNSIGGGLNFDNIGSFLKSAADPIEEAKAAKKSFDQVGSLDKVFSSPRHFAKAALHGYAGNMRAHSAYAKATRIFAPGVLPAGVALDEVAEGLDTINKTI